MEDQAFIKTKKRIDGKKKTQTINNKVEELFNSFARQYKEELMLYKQNSRRLSDKIQELEINIHEHKGALEYSKDIIKKKDDEISQKISEQNTLKQENEHLLKRFHELEKEFTAKELKYAQKIEAVNTEKMQINAEKAADALQHLKIVQELTANLNDLQEKLNEQVRETASLKEELKITMETNAQKMEELRNTFIEEKAINEAKFAKIIENLEVDLQLKQKEINRILLESENRNAAKNYLDEEQNSRANLKENPVECIACNLQTTFQVPSYTKAIAKTTPITRHPNKYVTRTTLRREEQQQEGHHMNCNYTTECSKNRATKRMACYTIDDSPNSSDDNEECTDVNTRPQKKLNLDVSFVTTSESCLRFQANQDVLSDHIVGETSESDVFDRLKLVD